MPITPPKPLAPAKTKTTHAPQNPATRYPSAKFQGMDKVPEASRAVIATNPKLYNALALLPLHDEVYSAISIYDKTGLRVGAAAFVRTGDADHPYLMIIAPNITGQQPEQFELTYAPGEKLDRTVADAAAAYLTELRHLNTARFRAHHSLIDVPFMQPTRIDPLYPQHYFEPRLQFIADQRKAAGLPSSEESLADRNTVKLRYALTNGSTSHAITGECNNGIWVLEPNPLDPSGKEIRLISSLIVHKYPSVVIPMHGLDSYTGDQKKLLTAIADGMIALIQRGHYNDRHQVIEWRAKQSWQDVVEQIHALDSTAIDERLLSSPVKTSPAETTSDVYKRAFTPVVPSKPRIKPMPPSAPEPVGLQPQNSPNLPKESSPRARDRDLDEINDEAFWKSIPESRRHFGDTDFHVEQNRQSPHEFRIKMIHAPQGVGLVEQEIIPAGMTPPSQQAVDMIGLEVGKMIDRGERRPRWGRPGSPLKDVLVQLGLPLGVLDEKPLQAPSLADAPASTPKVQPPVRRSGGADDATIPLTHPAVLSPLSPTNGGNRKTSKPQVTWQPPTAPTTPSSTTARGVSGLYGAADVGPRVEIVRVPPKQPKERPDPAVPIEPLKSLDMLGARDLPSRYAPKPIPKAEIPLVEAILPKGKTAQDVDPIIKRHDGDFIQLKSGTSVALISPVGLTRIEIPGQSLSAPPVEILLRNARTIPEEKYQLLGIAAHQLFKAGGTLPTGKPRGYEDIDTLIRRWGEQANGGKANGKQSDAGEWLTPPSTPGVLGGARQTGRA